MSSYQQIVKRVIPDVDFHQNHYARLLDRELRIGDRWLDIGAGSRIHDGFGVPSPDELAGRCEEVVGVDFEIEHLLANSALTSFVAGSAESLPFDDGQFNVVTANMVLEHLENPTRVLSEIARVLVRGGKFVFVTPNKNHPIPRISSLLLSPGLQRQIAHRIEGRPLEHIFPTFYRANTRSELARMATPLGFRIGELRVVRNIPYLRRPAFLTWMECQFIRATKRPMLQGLGADILGCLEKV